MIFLLFPICKMTAINTGAVSPYRIAVYSKAFTGDTPRNCQFGDLGRNALRGPDFTWSDFYLTKWFTLSERVKLRVEAQAFNIFNHTQFRIYDPDNPGSSGNNVISCYGGPDYSAGYVDPSGEGVNCLANSFLHPIDAHRPRTMQLGLKFIF